MPREYQVNLFCRELLNQHIVGGVTVEVNDGVNFLLKLAIAERLEALVEEIAAANRRLEHIGLIVNRRPEH